MLVSSQSPTLSSPMRLPCGAVLPNRIAKAAMTEGLSDASGAANHRHERLYRRWAEGGAGLLITGNFMVDWRYLERPGNIVVERSNNSDQHRALERLARAGTAAGGHLWAQISHPGRQCSRMSNARPVAPSAVQLKLAGFFGRPRELTESEIEAIIERFADSAEALAAAGFTGVQIHSAHGYLGSQFLSPRTNRRTDRWGGTLENRSRFLVETIRAVRRRTGADFPIGVKLNSADFQQGGFDFEDAARTAAILADEGIDLLEISGGTYERLKFFEEPEHQGEAASTRRREAYFLDAAQQIRHQIGDLPLMVTGGFRSRRGMGSVLEARELDVVGLARPLCVDPDLPRQLLAGSIDDAPRWERQHRLGPGPLSQTSRSKIVRSFNHQASAAWFYRQIIALADGTEPTPKLSARKALLLHFRDETTLALRRRRLGRGR